MTESDKPQKGSNDERDMLRDSLERYGIDPERFFKDGELDDTARAVVKELLKTADELKRRNENQQATIEELERVNSIDGLTGLPNDKALARELAQMLERRHNLGPNDGKRVNPPPFTTASLVFLDVDDFKQFNEQYGHAVGDVALKHIARQLRGTYDEKDPTFPEDLKLIRLKGKKTFDGLLRDDDIVGRIHGDEFAIIMLDTPPDKAEEIMKRVQQDFAKTPFIRRQKYDQKGNGGKVLSRAGNYETHVTFTYGVTDIREHDTISSLKERASQAMLDNKPQKDGDSADNHHHKAPDAEKPSEPNDAGTSDGKRVRKPTPPPISGYREAEEKRRDPKHRGNDGRGA